MFPDVGVINKSSEPDESALVNGRESRGAERQGWEEMVPAHFMSIIRRLRCRDQAKVGIQQKKYPRSEK